MNFDVGLSFRRWKKEVSYQSYKQFIIIIKLVAGVVLTRNLPGIMTTES